MSVLTDRLRGIVHGGAPPAPAPAPCPASASQVEDVLGGCWSSDRRTFVVERRFPAGAMHGRVRVSDVAAGIERAAADESVLSILTGQPPAPAPFLFFDLETTGLSGGAGTHAFLVGTGWFDGADFIVRQHLLVEYSAERPMLERVNADFLGARSLVSFNGKSFDAPVLDTRYLFHRLEWPGGHLPHVDALHLSRRFWRQTAGGARESCSLNALEHEQLGVGRVGDVPGFEIPARYFQFIRSGDARPLAAVFEHNRLDLMSLAGLTARLVHIVSEGPSAAESPWEALALGRSLARAGLAPRARAALEWAIASSIGRSAVCEAPRLEALRALALLLRRGRHYEEAASCWRRALEVPSCPPSLAREANEALAIHLEHRVRDLAAAKTCALQSLGDGNGDGEESGWKDAVRHRLQRIERKMTPVTARLLFPSSPSQPSCGSPTSAHRTSS